MTSGMQLVVFSAKDLDAAKRLFSTLLGSEPYVDQPYYVGYRVGELEFGLDPNAQSAGPICYWEVPDVEADSRTAGNLVIGRRARLGLGPTRDVVMIDAHVVAVHDAGTAPAGVADAYAAQADWDPRAAGPGYVYLVLSPTRIQAWRE